MKIGWRRKTDEEIISFVRNAYQKINDWKLALMSFYSALFMTIILVALTNVCYPDGLGIIFDQSRYRLSPIVIAWTIGISVGFAIGFFISLFAFVMINIFVELRTWRLLLDYHDHLHQAGLLPGDAAEKMETTTLPSPRS